MSLEMHDAVKYNNESKECDELDESSPLQWYRKAATGDKSDDGSGSD